MEKGNATSLILPQSFGLGRTKLPKPDGNGCELEMHTNCWTVTSRGIILGIVATTEGHKSFVKLGETGRERKLVQVPIEGSTVQDGKVIEAGATKRPSLVSFQADDPALVRIKTDQVYTRGCPGSR